MVLALVGIYRVDIWLDADRAHSHVDWHLDLGLAVVLAENPRDVAYDEPIPRASCSTLLRLICADVHLQRLGMIFAPSTTTTTAPTLRPESISFSIKRTRSLRTYTNLIRNS